MSGVFLPLLLSIGVFLPCHSIPPPALSPICFPRICICPKVTLSAVPARPSSTLSPLSACTLLSLLCLFPPERALRFSAVTASAQGLMVCNTLPAPLCRSGGPFIYKQREKYNQCVREHVPECIKRWYFSFYSLPASCGHADKYSNFCICHMLTYLGM